MENKVVDNWEHFEEELQKLLAERRSKLSTGLRSSEFLYRGHSRHDYPLSTTLERYMRDKCSLIRYYKLILMVKPEIEAFTGKNWDVLPYEKFTEWLKNFAVFIPYELPAKDYMIYLRHHGFPSPLLDWTRSPYIAAYFAFRKAIQSDGLVSIYVLWKAPDGMQKMSSDKPCIHTLGQYIRTHRRHFLQQSDYTICIKRDNEWFYESHEAAFAQGDTQQNILWKFNIPCSEAGKVLKLLDYYNINAYSLFGSEESLMETMALRKLHFQETEL